jgi:hypothetical protein
MARGDGTVTDEEKWEVLRVNIESLHASVHEPRASQRHDAISKLSELTEENDRRISMRIAELARKNALLDKIITGRRLNDLEG